MADIETSVVLTSQTDDLRSGMADAVASVTAATSAIDARLMELGGAAQQAQDRIVAATAEIGSSLESLRTTAAGLSGSATRTMGQLAQSIGTGNQFRGLSVVATGSDGAGTKSSRDDEVAQRKDTLDREAELDQNYYEQRQAAAIEDMELRQKLLQQEQLDYQNYLIQREHLDAEAVPQNEKTWQSIGQPIERALDKSITGLILGTTTVQKAVSNLAQSIVAEFVGGAVRSAFGGLGKLIGPSVFGSGGGDQDFSGVVAGAGADLLGGGILGGLFRGIGSIFGFERGGVVPSAQSGWTVPQLGPGGVLARLHSNEMVLPANLSQGLQSVIAAGGGNPAPNITFAVSALDSQSVATFFRNNGATLVAAINRAVRNGSPLAGAAT